MADRENWVTKRAIAKLSPTELRAKMEVRKRNLASEIYTLQDWLLRAVMQKVAHLCNVQQYRCDAMGAEEDEPHERFVVEKIDRYLFCTKKKYILKIYNTYIFLEIQQRQY